MRDRPPTESYRGRSMALATARETTPTARARIYPRATLGRIDGARADTCRQTSPRLASLARSTSSRRRVPRQSPQTRPIHRIDVCPFQCKHAGRRGTSSPTRGPLSSSNRSLEFFTMPTTMHAAPHGKTLQVGAVGGVSPTERPDPLASPAQFAQPAKPLDRDAEFGTLRAVAT